MRNALTNHTVAVLPVADDIVCVSCYNPVVVSRYNQHLPGVDHRTCTHTEKIQINTLLSQPDNQTEIPFSFHIIICHYLNC